MKELILSTGNKHKIEEISEILKDLHIKIIPISDFPQFPPTIEDGETLTQNAVKKAKEAAIFFNKWAIADDTGLEVEALNGAPGVYSARYAGEPCSYEDNNKKLLKELSGLPKEKRNACFKCVIAIASPNGQNYTAEGKIDGIISQSQSGTNGFGYDPIFFVEEYNKSFAELSPKVKNQISHRALALQKMKGKLKDIVNML